MAERRSATCVEVEADSAGRDRVAVDVSTRPPARERRPESRRPEPPNSPSPPDEQTTNWFVPLVVLIIGTFVSVLDTSIVNVAIPVIQKEFGESAENAQWISTSYSLTEGTMVPISAWLGTRVGPKRLYIWSLVGFTIASALCGLSDNLGMMIAFRILQGIPGGMLPVTCLTMIYRMVPPQKLGSAMGLYSLGVVVAPAIGPTLGGFFSEYSSWRLVYYVNLPVGVLGVVAAAAVLVAVPGRKDKPLDLVGFVCVAGGLFALLLAFEEGPDWGWTGFRVLILFALSLDLFVTFVIIELQREHPLIDLRIMARPQFSLSLLLMTSIFVGLFVEFFYVPQFLQGARNFTPVQAGLALVPQACMLLVLMPITGRLYDRLGPRWLATIGMTLTGIGLLMLAGLTIDTTMEQLTIGMVVMATGFGLSVMPVFTGGLAALDPELADSGGAMITLVQRVASALGLGILSALVTFDRAQFTADRSALMDSNVPRIAAVQVQGTDGLLGLWQQLSGVVAAQSYGNAFFIAGWLALGSAALALFMPTGRPSGAAEQVVAH